MNNRSAVRQNPDCTEIDAAAAAGRLREADNILLLTHQFPDGDTLGSGFALCHALSRMGKTVRVACSDAIPARYDYMRDGLAPSPDFEPAFVCAVDVADPQLLGAGLAKWAERIDLCVDHHPSNTRYARELYLQPAYAATAMMAVELVRELGEPFDPVMASCLYTGIATDTGCFKYANTTAQTLRMAADLLEAGARSEMINRTMFDMKSRARVELERLALSGMRFYFDGRCAVMTITADMVVESGAGEDDMEGLAPLPRQIEGVWAGVTLREKEDGAFKISIRSGSHVDASLVCQQLGGGGHQRAAGCTVAGPAREAARAVLTALKPFVDRRD